jgi:hypothetical protein
MAMAIDTLNKDADGYSDKRMQNEIQRIEALLADFKKRTISNEAEALINAEIADINSIAEDDKRSVRKLAGMYQNILALLEKHMNLVWPNWYQSRWMAIGMAAFGLPIGVAFGAALGSMAFISLGLPIGLSIGIGIGSGMDKKAKEEGRQLEL